MLLDSNQILLTERPMRSSEEDLFDLEN